VLEFAVNKKVRNPRSYWEAATIVSRIRDPAVTMKLLEPEGGLGLKLKRLYDKRYTTPATVVSGCDSVAFARVDQRAAATTCSPPAVKSPCQNGAGFIGI
jgi:hypothetical protein